MDPLNKPLDEIVSENILSDIFNGRSETTDETDKYTNLEFLKVVLRETQGSVFLVGFAGNPAAVPTRVWAGRSFAVNDLTEVLTPTSDQNAYFSLATFLPDAEGKTHRRKANFHELHAIMLDDIGTKVPSESIETLKPSWLIETSHGNFQAGYVFQKPLRDRSYATRILDGLIAKGLCDPGANGPATRLARLPIGINGKHNSVFITKLAQFNPELVYQPEELISAFGLDLEEKTKKKSSKKSKATYTPKPDRNPVLDAIKAQGLYNAPISIKKRDITCPWVTSHYSLLNPPVREFLIKAEEFSKEPSPISWLVKHWLQSSALIMVHGPSGGGKTFFVLDVCKHIASSKAEWNGHKVNGGAVVYLAGEGHHGLRGRSAAWDFKNKPHNDVELWFSKHGCDLNIASGYNLVVEHIRALPVVPCLIVVDTLHRFLHGDENSAQDAKTMIDACAALMKEFGCSVLLVHHTGVSEDSQHRARGSSSYKGALDIEISVIPPKDGHAGQIIQRKSKDAEQADDIFFELESVTIPKWFDEDGEPVTSAVFVTASAPPPKAEKKDSKFDAFRKMHERYWWETGAQEHEGMPYIDKKDFIRILEEDGLSERTIKNYLNAGQPNGMINVLINEGYIAKREKGFVIINEVAASALLMQKNGEKGRS